MVVRKFFCTGAECFWWKLWNNFTLEIFFENMEGTIRFETCDGKETSVNAKALCEKSPYFKALLSKKWKEGETGVVSLDISQKKGRKGFLFCSR
nr:hypothetical protein [Marseillevirus cajuinensis]